MERVTAAWREYVAVAEETAREDRMVSRLSRSVSAVVADAAQVEWERAYGKER
ncbi:hypothetical protein SAMN04487905_1217 [Actinopolyspora xinjiangensis]|uniref:Uncharacterized protein n=1 Tax=Actinopolyspora xinjiangensis TaxID=405564 RepID=A0A1H0X0Y7_9ACTN|nr:hypothetical protein SAMN04487905_1217 [Actinopolyspora xinjiangensis]